MDETIQDSEPGTREGGGEAVERPSAIPAEPLPPITSRFLYVDVAALRAKQLRRGAKVRFAESEAPTPPRKPERVAMEEVRRGLVYYDVPAAKPAGDQEDEA